MAVAIPISLEQVMASQPPPGLEEWRKRLFLVEGTIEMSEDEYDSLLLLLSFSFSFLFLQFSFSLPFFLFLFLVSLSTCFFSSLFLFEPILMTVTVLRF